MLKIFLAICCLFSVANAQLPKASEFLPLQVGNIWQHQHYLGSGAGTQSEVVSDSLLGDTLRVYKLMLKSLQKDPPIPAAFGYRYYNLDSTVVYASENFPEQPFDEGFIFLDTRNGLEGRWIGDFGDIALTMAITDTGSVFLFEHWRLWAEVNTIIEEADTFRIDATYHARHLTGVGLTRFGIDTLLYAKIDGEEFGTPITSVQDNVYRNSSSTPNDFRLKVYPNPVRTQATFYLERVPKGQTEVVIYDILGRKIRSFQFNGSYHETTKINWDGRDANNQIVASGIYFVMVRASHLFKTHKFIYLR